MATKKKKKKKKLPALGTLKRKALKLWALQVKEIHKNRCAICGSPDTLNSHHIEDKCNYALRYDVINGICLCAGCHNFRKNSAHRSTIFFYEWLLENRPQVIEYVRNHRNDSTTYDRARLNALIESLSSPAAEDVLAIINVQDPKPIEPELPSSSDPQTPLFSID